MNELPLPLQSIISGYAEELLVKATVKIHYNIISFNVSNNYTQDIISYAILTIPHYNMIVRLVSGEFDKIFSILGKSNINFEILASSKDREEFYNLVKDIDFNTEHDLFSYCDDGIVSSMQIYDEALKAEEEDEVYQVVLHITELMIELYDISKIVLKDLGDIKDKYIINYFTFDKLNMGVIYERYLNRFKIVDNKFNLLEFDSVIRCMTIIDEIMSYYDLSKLSDVYMNSVD